MTNQSNPNNARPEMDSGIFALGALAGALISGFLFYTVGNNSGKREATRETTTFISRQLTEETSRLGIQREYPNPLATRPAREYSDGLKEGIDSLQRVQADIDARYEGKK